ncbi:MAG TPA: cyclic nucleotide-binding domain-containing protein [Oligoflexus sp.]|uniref:cyclic nucleotide-binding domain-containing protein n=1 Tax=Oligoflexus sp. TaxID=1971216 RepID=UPI002D4A887E|nr:cyclic nucleotide-binding domain-containing protein [Oligoflexus sp.]HYX33666.1 cyclic nucleotide-binding domain-containing protein [Oligoflexus sp.]
MRATTLIAALIILLGILYLAWQLINSNLAGRARRDQKKRKSDRRRLSRAEKRAYRYAQKLYQEGNFRGCAKILEQLGMLRESINILEKAGLIKDAADVLIRIQRPNRAGYMLARYGMWKEAMECYKKANMPMEVGKCARELGDLPTAIPYFMEAGATLEAAECYLELGKHHDSARLFLRNKEFDRALDQYIHLVDSHPDIDKIDFAEEELNFIMRKLIEEKVDTRLTDILVARKRMVKLMVELIRNNNLASASAAYLRNTSDIGPELISYKDFSRDENILLGALFNNVGAYEYSGMVYERMAEFDKAGESFEKGELFERAAYCYERAMNKAKATEMQIMSTQRGTRNITNSKAASPNRAPEPSKPKAPQKSPNPFSIQDTTTDAMVHAEPQARMEIKGLAAQPAVPSPTDAYLKKTAPVDAGARPQQANPGPDRSFNWDAFLQAEFLVDLSTPEQELLQDICKAREYPKGAVILEFNHEPIGIYFLLRGTISIWKRDASGTEFEADKLEETDTFGELWLLMDQPTRVKFVAQSTVQVGWIKRADFEMLMDKNGAIARKLYKRYALRLVNKLVNDQNQKTNRVAS